MAREDVEIKFLDPEYTSVGTLVVKKSGSGTLQKVPGRRIMVVTIPPYNFFFNPEVVRRCNNFLSYHWEIFLTILDDHPDVYCK